MIVDMIITSLFCITAFVFVTEATPAPTVAPTFSSPPSALPTVVPTAPTAAPSLAVRDCKVSCTVVGPFVTVSIYPDNLIARVILPRNFKITFALRRITLPDTEFTVNNVITIRESQVAGPQRQFMKFGIMSQNTSTVELGTNGVQYSGPGLTSDYIGLFTTYTVIHLEDKLTVTSTGAAGNPLNAVLASGSAPNTTGRVFDIYVAGADSWYDTDVGLLRSFVISSKFPRSWLYSLCLPTNSYRLWCFLFFVQISSTGAPTAAPTPNPTTQPSAQPISVAPTSSPTLGITDCRQQCLLAYGGSVEIRPNTVIARVRMSPHFRLSFAVRRVTLPHFLGDVNNMLSLIEESPTDGTGAADGLPEVGSPTDDAPALGGSLANDFPASSASPVLLKFGLNSDSYSKVEYAGGAALLDGPGLTIDYVGEYTSFAVEHDQGYLRIDSNAAGSLSSELFIGSSMVSDTSDKVYNVYVADPNAWTDSSIGLMQGITIECEALFCRWVCF